MGFISVLIAAAAAWAFGAIWYMVLAKPWMAANDLKEEDIDRSDKVPFIVSFVCLILVAGMMRHILAMGGIEELGKGAVTGLGLGIFVAAPWIVLNNRFSGRPNALSMIDGGYATIGCVIIGAVLTMF